VVLRNEEYPEGQFNPMGSSAVSYVPLTNILNGISLVYEFMNNQLIIKRGCEKMKTSSSAIFILMIFAMLSLMMIPMKYSRDLDR
jgi:hypothetical protein